MFERFTERGRQAIVLAQEEARGLNHSYVGTEHILLGLVRERQGIAGRVLETLDIPVERVRSEVVRTIGTGEEPTSGQIPFTPRAKKVLELSLAEAVRLGHGYIGTEHILLGLLREKDGVAAHVLREFDADPQVIESEVTRLLPGPDRQAQPEPLGWAEGRRARIYAAWLEQLELVLERLTPEIRRELGREPDSGDLLLVLACAPDATSARVLGELDIELDALSETLELVRDPQRWRQRQGVNRPSHGELLDTVRRHLGLPEPPAG